MKKFDEQLLRLKQVVKLTEDQDVAVLLGLSKAAFSDRKKRDAFPEDKLWALAKRRPELLIDPMYVLMGDAKDVAVKLTIAQLEAALALTADQGGTLAEQFKRAGQIVEEMHRPMPADEQMLLDAYRALDAAGKKALLASALGVTPPTSAPGRVKAQPDMRGMSQHNTAPGSVQVGYAGGQVKVKNGR